MYVTLKKHASQHIKMPPSKVAILLSELRKKLSKVKPIPNPLIIIVEMPFVCTFKTSKCKN